MPKSVLEAIRMGLWDFEPPDVDEMSFEAADAMPGTPEKINILAERVRKGLPLWHKYDRVDMDAPPPPRPLRKSKQDNGYT